ncbi:cytochrome b/b6 domain-containing protein [Erwinia aphidicola]|uniref:cytochrome b/b6 domain-containing protein n=1 Tax=Erwinia aphidicola TaxID=68334 RepID=UPI0029644814|nr:cytochrome b/b6 domain-containing protein [Erwinia aphidicola]
MNKAIRISLPHADAPFFRGLHILVALMILAQIINSNFTEREALDEQGLTSIITWMHVISGFSLIMLGALMLGWMLAQRGARYYFSWLHFDFSDIAQDIATLKRLRLPEAHSGGIAATIQGLGVLSLLGVALSGGIWFLLNAAQNPLAHSVIHWHKNLTTFVEIYFFAHGAMGLLHIFLNSKLFQR